MQIWKSQFLMRDLVLFSSMASFTLYGQYWKLKWIEYPLDLTQNSLWTALFEISSVGIYYFSGELKEVIYFKVPEFPSLGF